MTLMNNWTIWFTRLVAVTNHAIRIAPIATCSCHRGGPDPHTSRGARAMKLRTEMLHQQAAAYTASRYK